MKRLRYLAFGFLVPTIALAQGLRDRDPDLTAAKRVASELQQANFHYGPFYLWSRIRVSDAGFTESFYLPTGDHSGGVALSVEAPQRVYFVPHKKTIFTAEVVPGYAFTRSTDKTGQFNYLLRGDAHFLFNHLYLDVYTVGASQLRAYAADVNRLATVEERETGVSGEWKYSSRTSAIFVARYRDSAHPQDKINPLPTDRPVALLDRNERNGRLAFQHKTFPLTSLLVAGELSDYEFDHAKVKNSTRRVVTAGAVRDSGRMSVRVEAGPAELDFDDPTQEDFSGLVGTLFVTRGNGRWIYGGSLERDLGFSVLAAGNYYVANRGRLTVSYAARRRLTLRAQTTLERDVYEQRDPEGNRRKDTISFTTVGAVYTLRRIQLGSDVGWLERTTTYEGDVDSGIRWTLLLSFSP